MLEKSSSLWIAPRVSLCRPDVRLPDLWVPWTVEFSGGKLRPGPTPRFNSLAFWMSFSIMSQNVLIVSSATTLRTVLIWSSVKAMVGWLLGKSDCSALEKNSLLRAPLLGPSKELGTSGGAGETDWYEGASRISCFQ